ncbi:MAG TPA: LuxR family transcriptional regulator, partial [Dehalococcoidia bacterium]|nr:LuxR family transcriptional regulator [Dehalococcoidia bacterium]
HFALGAEAAELRARASVSKSGRAAKTLVKEGPLRITLVALSKGTSLQSHDVAGPLSIQSLRGRLRIMTDTGDVDVPIGSLAVLDAGVVHSAKALDDCAALITVAMG